MKKLKLIVAYLLIASTCFAGSGEYEKAVTGGGGGGVTTPGSTTDNAVVRWNGAGGSAIQNSVVTIGDTGVTAGITDLSVNRMAAGSTATFGPVSTETKQWHFSETITDFTSATTFNGLDVSVTLNPSVDLTGGNVKYNFANSGSLFVPNTNTHAIEIVEAINYSALHSGQGKVTGLVGGVFGAVANGPGGAAQMLGVQGSASNDGANSTVDALFGAFFSSGVGHATATNTIDYTVYIATPDHVGTMPTHYGLLIDNQGFGAVSRSILSNGGDVEFSGITGQATKFFMSGFDVAQPATALASATTWLRFEPISGTAGGAQVSAFSDTDAQPMAFVSVFGSTNPTDATPAISFTGAKSDGGTGKAALGNAETVLGISNNTTGIFAIFGNGNASFLGTVNSAGFTGALTGNASTATALAANGANCSAGSYALGVDASGASENCTVATTGTVTSVATGVGITGGTITATGTIALKYTDTLAGNPSIGVGEAVFDSTEGGILFEGSAADGLEGALIATTIAGADRTWTLPNVTGTIITTGDTATVTGTMVAADTITSSDIDETSTYSWSSLAGLNTFVSGVAVTAGSYQSGRDNDGTNQFHINYPTGASFELSANDVATITNTATATTFIQAAATTGSPTAFTLTAGTHTTLTASGEVTDVNFNLARAIGITGGALATNRSVRVQKPTFAFTSLSTLTTAVTFDLDGAPTSGNANTQITNPSTIRAGGNATYIGTTGFTYRNLLATAHTITLSGTTTVTSATPSGQLSLAGITFTNASAGQLNFASTFYIGSAATASGSETILNNYAGWVDAGSFRFDGSLLFGNAGLFTMKGDQGSNNEDLTYDFETSANKVLVTTSTGVTSVDYGTIDLETDALDLSDGNIANVGTIAADSINADASTVDYNDVNILELPQADLTSTCTLGQIALDTGGAVKELCYCQATNTWLCTAMSAGPTD